MLASILSSVKNNATSLSDSLLDARFWVRPFEFEGDGSLGAADDVASLEVGGKMRTFWLKRLDGRLFFREIGRDENWNFGTLDPLAESDLPAVLARALKSESYGRVVLPKDMSRPCCFVATPDSKFQLVVPNSHITARGAWSPQRSSLSRPFIERAPGVYGMLASRPLYRQSKDVHNAFGELSQISIPVIRRRWSRGSEQEWEQVSRAFFHRWWPHFSLSPDSPVLHWELKSAWSMEGSDFRQIELWGHWAYFVQWPPNLKRRANVMSKQFSFVGQGKTEQLDKWGRNITGPRLLRGRVSPPTHHETLEAHLLLRDWINERLPLAKAKEWLDFS